MNKNIIYPLAGLGIAVAGYFIFFKSPKNKETPTSGTFSKTRKCSNLQSKNNIKKCLADTIENYMSENIDGVGDCVNIKVDVALPSTNVFMNRC